jgi:hypothetical protein
MTSSLLVAALLGVGLSFLLLNNLAHAAPRKSLLLIIGCIILGTILSNVASYFISSKPGHSFYPDVMQCIYVALIILTVTVRMRQSAAREP